MKENSSIDFPQHGEVFYFYGHALRMTQSSDFLVAVSYIQSHIKNVAAIFILEEYQDVCNPGGSGRAGGLPHRRDGLRRPGLEVLCRLNTF
jgi:hypothetical protein